MSKRPRFTTPFESHHVKESQTLLKSALQPIYSFVWSIWERSSCKTSLLAISEVLGLFANTFAAYDKYSLHNTDNLLQPFQMQLIKE